MENEPVDPVSGNTVPPGSSPEEVRDDVDAKLSSGEYVLSADVVRYLGVEKIESLVAKAREAMEQLAGGEEELPFSAEELQMAPAQAPQEAPVQMATGGLVLPRVHNPLEENLPQWMVDQRANQGASQGSPEAAEQGRMGSDPNDRNTRKGLGGPVSGWSMQDMSKYAANINNPALGAIDGLISALPGLSLIHI